MYCWQKITLGHIEVHIVSLEGDIPVSCLTVNCSNLFSVDSGIVFMYFLLTAKEKKQWVQAISRDKWEPKSHHHLCGEHFVGGRPSKVSNSIDYILTIFKDRKRRCNVAQKDEERRLRAVKREKARKESAEVHKCAQTLLDLPANTSLSSTDQCTIITNCIMDENILLAKEVQDLRQQVIYPVIQQYRFSRFLSTFPC